MDFNILKDPISYIDLFTTDYIIIGQTIIDILLNEPLTTINTLTKSSLDNFLSVLISKNIKFYKDKYDNIIFYHNDLKYRIYFTNDSYENFLSNQITTINSLAVNRHLELIDLYDGVSDINKKIIRLIDNTIIYKDNKLMIKLIRYSAEYGFRLHESLFKIINDHSPNILLVNNHIIKDEIIKICMSDHPEYIKDLETYGLLKYIIPELHLCFYTEQENPWHIYNVGDHTIEVLKNTPKDFDIRIAALFHDIGKCFCKRVDSDGIAHFHGHSKISKEKANTIFDRLFFSQKEVKLILKLIELHDYKIGPKAKSVRKFISSYNISDDFFDKLMKLQYADMMGKNLELIKPQIEILENIKTLYNTIKMEKITQKELNITGKDLIDNGFDRRKVKVLLEMLLTHIINNPEDNNRETLFKIAGNLEKKIRI